MIRNVAAHFKAAFAHLRSRRCGDNIAKGKPVKNRSNRQSQLGDNRVLRTRVFKLSLNAPVSSAVAETGNAVSFLISRACSCGVTPAHQPNDPCALFPVASDIIDSHRGRQSLMRGGVMSSEAITGSCLCGSIKFEVKPPFAG